MSTQPLDDLDEASNAWDERWRAYDAASQRNPAQRLRRKLILDALARTSSEPLRILDLGCGQGDFLRDAGRRFPAADLAGVDVSRAGLEIARQKASAARLFEADFAAADPVPSELRGFATHVVCTEVLEHLDDPAGVLQRAAPALAPGGVLLVTVPGGPQSAFDLHIGHRRHYSPRALVELARTAGYDEVEVKGAGFPFFNLYKLVVILRGERIARDIDQASPPSRPAELTMRAFDGLFNFNADWTGLGWQTFGVFQRRAAGAGR